MGPHGLYLILVFGLVATELALVRIGTARLQRMKRVVDLLVTPRDLRLSAPVVALADGP